jgi:uncharacterized membrane protein
MENSLFKNFWIIAFLFFIVLTFAIAVILGRISEKEEDKKKKDNLIIASSVLAIPAICVVSYKILPSVIFSFIDFIRKLGKNKNMNTTINLSDKVSAVFRPQLPKTYNF